MPELRCGCILMKETIWLEKEIRDDNGKLIENVRMCHDYYHLIDKTGENQKKVELFNKGEELRMNMTKRMFNILVDEEKYDVDNDEVDVDNDEVDVEDKNDDDEEEVEDDDDAEPPYEELKAYLKTMNQTDREKYHRFETLRNLANGYPPNYKMKNIYKAINELQKEEEQQ